MSFLRAVIMNWKPGSNAAAAGQSGYKSKVPVSRKDYIVEFFSANKIWPDAVFVHDPPWDEEIAGSVAEGMSEGTEKYSVVKGAFTQNACAIIVNNTREVRDRL